MPFTTSACVLLAQDFYSCHGENALFVARTFYKSLAVVKYIGGSFKGLAGPLLSHPTSHAPIHSSARSAHSSGLDRPGVTLNKNLFETALHFLLVESAEYHVQLFEGSGSSWRKTRCGAACYKRSLSPMPGMLCGSLRSVPLLAEDTRGLRDYN